MKKSILKIMLGAVILEVVLVCIFIMIGSFDSVTYSSLASVGIIIGYSIPCLFYSKIYDNEKYKYIAISGAIIVCVSAIISILNLWNLIEDSNILRKILVTFNVVIFMLAFISWILSYVSINKLLSLFKKISISLIIITSLLLMIITWTNYPEGFILRLYYVLGVLTIGSFICTFIITRIYKKEIDQAIQNENVVSPNINNAFTAQTITTAENSGLNSINSEEINLQKNHHTN